MKTFIRLDTVGHWLGTEHISSMRGDGERFESGVSCYEFDARYMSDLYNYWINTACIDRNDVSNMQVTIFEGYKVGEGFELEDCAVCERTIAEIQAMPLYDKWKELEERFYDDEYTDCCSELEYIEEHAQEIMQLLNEMMEESK